MSAAAVGNAFAGAGATAEDASTLYYNPAGLSRMPGRQFTVGGAAIKPSIRFNDQGSTTVTGARLNGGEGGDAGSWAAVPALYYATDVMPGMRFGIGLQSAFGLKTEYDNGWAGRYHALKSELKTVNLNPTLAYAVNDRWSIGLGVSAQYAKVELSRAIDFGSVCAGSLGLARCVPSGFLPQARDGKVTLDGDEWAFGFNLGALYMPTPAMRFGLSHRSSIQHKLSGGSARFDRPAGLSGPLAAASAFADSGVSATLDLPETVNLSAYVGLDNKWALLGDLNWTRWSRFEELRVKFDNGSPDSVVKEAWRNTVRAGAGVNYRYNDAWLLRGGLSYEPSPVKDAFRTPAFPIQAARSSHSGCSSSRRSRAPGMSATPMSLSRMRRSAVPMCRSTATWLERIKAMSISSSCSTAMCFEDRCAQVTRRYYSASCSQRARSAAACRSWTASTLAASCKSLADTLTG